MSTATPNYHFELAARFVRDTSRNIFLTGKAGTGKTTFLRHIRQHCSKKMAVIAPTGVAAINAGGVTIHSFFQLPLGGYVPSGMVPDSGEQLFNNRQTLLRQLRLSQSRRELIRELELLVIDEVSMLRADMLDAMDAILRHVRKQPLLPFGGVQVLFIGDLLQLPPVAGEREWSFLKMHYETPFFFDAHVLKDASMVCIELRHIYRQSDQEFINLLNKVRNNEADAMDLQWLNNRYRQWFEPPSHEQYITLTTHNSRADLLNQQALSRLAGDVFHFPAVVTGDFPEKAYPVEPDLALKKGAQIMFIKNDKGEERRFYNGKLATVQEISEDAIHVAFAGEEAILELERETWRNIRYQYNKSSDRIDEEELGTFSQYPVRLAWAITIHKSQGLSFDRAIIDAGAAFAPGQVYVALSRLTSLDGLILRSRIGLQSIRTDERVLRFVAAEREPAELERELLLSEQDFIKDSLFKAFRLEGLKDVAEGWLMDAEKRAGTGLQVMEWAHLFRQQVAQLMPVSEKTTLHLEQYFSSAGKTFGPLAERMTAAVGYFTGSLNRMLADLKDHAEKMSREKRTGKYLKELAVIEAMLSLRIKFLEKSTRLTTALAAGESNGNLLEMIAERPSTETITGEHSGKKKQETKGARVKGESNRISLDQFREGKSVAEIAKTRGLAASTITGHLIGFIGTGELQASQFVDSDKIGKIQEVLAGEEQKNLTAIKEKLGRDYSYEEIRAVLAEQGFHQQKGRS